jgi:hypothetical protein
MVERHLHTESEEAPEMGRGERVTGKEKKKEMESKGGASCIRVKERSRKMNCVDCLSVRVCVFVVFDVKEQA